MAKMGRPPLAIPRTQISVQVSDDVLAEVKLLLMDPTRQRWTTKHGALTNLVDSLLRAWVEEQRKAVQQQGELNERSDAND